MRFCVCAEAPGSTSQVFLNLHFLLVQNLKVRDECESFGSSHVFPGRRPQPPNDIQSSPEPFMRLSSQLFLLSLWSASCLPHLLPAPQAGVILNNCHKLWENCLHRVSTESEQRRTSPESEARQVTYIMTIPWERGYLESSKLPTPVIASHVVFIVTMIVRLGFQDHSGAGDGKRAIENTTKLTVLMEIGFFFLP